MKTYDAQEAAAYGFDRVAMRVMADRAAAVAFWLRRMAAECTDEERRASLNADAAEYTGLNKALCAVVQAYDQGKQAEAA
jgi:hypothetical protein